MGNTTNFKLIAFSLILVEIVLLNILLPFPDNNDFYELSRICLLMDSNVKYCVNNNWGFAHPLSCWLLTKETGNLLVAQRLVNATFMFVFLFVFLKLCSHFEITFKKLNLITIILLLLSPWVIDIIVSAHIDIAPITLVFSGLLLMIMCKRPFLILLAGAIVGSSYWFRFHFLSFALLFPVLVLFIKKDKLTYLGMFIFSAIGVAVSISIPHILCKYSYGVFSISNEKFVMAQALGVADWSYGFAQKLDSLTIHGMLKRFDYKLFVLKYVYHFLKSGIFPFLIIFGIVIFDYIKKCRIKGIFYFTDNSKHFQILLIVTYALIAVVPFTILRGFTYRLEAAFIFFLFLLILWATASIGKKKFRIITIILLLMVIYQQAVYGKQFIANRSILIHNSKLITANIPLSILQKEPQSVICCVDFYNPYNKYLLCNPMVFAGWGVRFKPFTENFGLLDLSNPFENAIYTNAQYIVVPSNPEYFKYPQSILTNNKVIAKDKDVLIICKDKS